MSALRYDSDEALLKSAAAYITQAGAPAVRVAGRRFVEALKSLERAKGSANREAIRETSGDVDAARESLVRAMRGVR